MRRERLDALLSGTPGGKRALSAAPAELRAAVLAAARNASTSGTSWALGAVEAVIGFAALLCLRFPRR